MPVKDASKFGTFVVGDAGDAVNCENLTMSNGNTMSDYELLRQQKMQRNQEKLRSLGLLTSNDEAAPRKSANSIGAHERHVETSHRRSNSVRGRQPPSRRMSLRLRGINPFPTGKKISNKPQILDKSTNQIDASDSNERTARIGNQQSGNKSTTKEHCQMRIRTMSIPQLQHRIRIIERAQGQHCVAKLSIMYECCIDANLHELAQEAEDALQRLTATRK